MTHIDVVTMDDLYKEDINGYFPCLLEIYNPDIVWDSNNNYGQENCYLRLICDENQVVYKDKTYLPASFVYTPANSDGKKIGNAQLSITALDFRVKKILRSIKVASTVKVMAFFVKVQKENEEQKPVYRFKNLDMMSFSMEAASADKSAVKFNLTFDRSMQQNVPYHVATQDRVPATRG